MDVLSVAGIIAGVIGAVTAAIYSVLSWWRSRRPQHTSDDQQLRDIEPRTRAETALAYLKLEFLEVRIVKVAGWHPSRWSQGASVVVVALVVVAIVLALALLIGMYMVLSMAAMAATDLMFWLQDKLQQRLGPARVWQLGIGILGTIAVIYILPRVTGLAGDVVGFAVGALLDLIAALSLLALAASWAPEWHTIPFWIRDDALMLRRIVYEQDLVQQLTAGWDWEHLRLAATTWVGIQALRLSTISGVNVPFASALSIFALLGLTVVQYAAVGGGQPVWAMEHLLDHLMNLAGFTHSDFDALKQLARDHFKARTFHLVSLRSQALLLAIAFFLARGIRTVV